MISFLRETIWRSLGNRESYEAIKRMYRESCGEQAEKLPSFEELPDDTPHKFSAILAIASEAIMCGIRSCDISEIPREHLVRLRRELLRLYTDLIMEEKEYRVSLRPHKIEDLLIMIDDKDI